MQLNSSVPIFPDLHHSALPHLSLYPSRELPQTYHPRPPLLPPPHVIILLPSTTTHDLFQQSPFNLILVLTGRAITQNLLTLWNVQQLHPILLRPLPQRVGGIFQLLAHLSLCRVSSIPLTFPNLTTQSPAIRHCSLLHLCRHKASGRRDGDFWIHFPGPSAQVALLTRRPNHNHLKRAQAQSAKTKKRPALRAKRHKSGLCKKIRPSSHQPLYHSPLRIFMSSEVGLGMSFHLFRKGLFLYLCLTA